MALVTTLATSDTFRQWLRTTNTVIDLLNTTTVRATINAVGAFAVSNTSDTTSSLTLYHATGGNTLANSTGLFLSGNTTFSGLNFTANASSNVFTVSSNTTLLDSLGGTRINSAVTATTTMVVNGAVTLSNTLAVTGLTTLTGNVTSSHNHTVVGTSFAKGVVFSETGALVSDVASVASYNNYNITGLVDASVLQINPNARNIELTGLLAPTNLTTLASGGNGAKVLYLQNTGGTYKITLTHADTASTDLNRFVGVGSSDVIIPSGGAATLLYTVAESRWRILGQVEPHVHREQTAASAATLTPNADESDTCTLYQQAEPLTIANPSPAATAIQGQKLIIRITDDGTPRAITWGSEYRAIQSSLPTTTTAGKILYLGFIYHRDNLGAYAKWDLVANALEA
jgi:hypothetical protein